MGAGAMSSRLNLGSGSAGVEASSSRHAPETNNSGAADLDLVGLELLDQGRTLVDVVEVCALIDPGSLRG